MYKAEIGDVVTGTDDDGQPRIGRVAAAMEFPAGMPPSTVIVATPEGDWRVDPARLRVVRPNFVQETWNAIGHQGPHPWAGSEHN